jgi:hypothetical protein
MNNWQGPTLVVLAAFLLSSVPLTTAQEPERTKGAEGEYRVTMEGDLGCGPIETEVFHFSESWIFGEPALGTTLRDTERLLAISYTIALSRSSRRICNCSQ